MAAPWTPLIRGHATRSKPLPIPVLPLAAPAAPPPQAATTRTPAQVQKDTYAGRISDKWPIPKNRRNKASRGLRNIGNSCFQISALQSLYHLRKFMNWILTHNVTKRGGVVENPCDLTQTVAGQCVACLMKRLIKKYWGNNNLTSGVPNALPTTDVDMIAMQSVVDSWFPRIADRHTGLFTYRPQQDAEDFQSKVLQACFNSTLSLL
jgi:ubiquitin C-terminal hydrolase